MNHKPLSVAEGIKRGQEDRAAHNSYDPLRWVKAWAPKLWAFEQGYSEGFYGRDPIQPAEDRETSVR